MSETSGNNRAVFGAKKDPLKKSGGLIEKTKSGN